jgi:hypothetical protein
VCELLVTSYRDKWQQNLHLSTYFIGLLVYFLYGIHHSKESDIMSSYSVLMTSSEAGKGKWGSMHSTGPVQILSPSEEKAPPATKPPKDISTDDKRPIVDEEEVVQ